jgi:hypothetical protein
MSKHPAYGAWANIRRRCENARCSQFYNYGGRGIRVCSDWKTFAGFWFDMGSSYSPGLTIDRTDTNGDYSFENCRWVPQRIQCHNQRKRLQTTSRFKGVYFSRQWGKWRATIRAGGLESSGRQAKKIHLGYFLREEDAARAYDRAALKYFGPTAFLNFPL